MMVRIKTDQLTDAIANSLTSLANRVTIRISTPFTSSSGIIYFSGYIPDRTLNLRAENNMVEIVAFGFASRMFDINYRSGTTVSIDKTAGITASDLAIDVIDKVRAIDANFPINYQTSPDSVQDSVVEISDKFVLMKAGQVLNKAVLLAFDASRIWHWVVNGDNIFRFKKDSATADHVFTYEKDAIEFPRFSETLQQSLNEIFIVYDAGSAIKRVIDQDSIDLYGVRDETLNESNATDATTAEQLGNALLASRIPPIRLLTVRVVSKYPIESINPGDTCRIDNLPPDIAQVLTTNMFITKTSYYRDYVDLDLSIKHPFLQNQIEAIRRRLEKESVEDSSATTYS